MLKRLTLILILLFAPLVAYADDASSALGPPANAGGGASSNADSSVLQPAGLAPLQATTGDSDGLTAPTQTALQAPVTSGDSLQVIASSADGPSHDPAAANYWGWLWFTLLIALLVTAAAVVMRDRRRFAGQH